MTLKFIKPTTKFKEPQTLNVLIIGGGGREHDV